MIIKKCVFILAIFIATYSYLFSQTSPGDIEHLSSITSNLSAPVRIAIDNSDNIFVTDASKNCINKYDNSGNFLNVIYSGGKPVSIAINSNNSIFFGDGETGHISKLNTDGTTTEIFTNCIFPSSMVFGTDSYLYIVDREQKSVFVIDTLGNLINTIGSGTLILPTGITFDSKNNRILVTEHGGIGTGFNLNAKIWKFDLQGNLLGSFGSYGVANGKFYRIQGLAINKCGNIFIPDPFQGDISVFDESEVFITKFGSYGDSLGQLNLPLDIAIDSKERIIMASTNNGSLEIFNIKNPTAKIFSTNPVLCNNGTAEIAVQLTGNSPWSITYTRNATDSVTVDSIVQNPYVFSVSDTGLYEIVNLTGGSYAGACIIGNVEIQLANSSVAEFNFSYSGNEVSFVNNSTNADSYFWDFGDGFTSNEISPIHIYQLSGDYVVTLVASNGVCFDNVLSQTVSISVVGISKIDKNEKINIFPNPSTGFVKIESLNFKNEYKVAIFNLVNQNVFSTVLTPNNNSVEVDMQSFAKGIYYINIISDESIYTSKLVLTE